MAEPRRIGGSGLKVQPVGLGCMPLSLDRRPAEDEGVNVICAALDAGMDFLDTADVYCIDQNDIGHNERLVARALSEWNGDASKIVVATKGGLERPRGDWVTNGTPEHLRAACEKSLKALGVEAITLYQLHAPDPQVPFADSVGALARLREEGKILHVGLSNVSVSEIRQAASIVDVVSVQNACNPHRREAFTSGVVAHCERSGIAFIAYSPVGGHFGKARVETDPVLRAVGKRLGATPYQVALAWLLAKSPNMIPIPGASRPESARKSAAVPALALGPDHLAELDRAFPV